MKHAAAFDDRRIAKCLRHKGQYLELLIYGNGNGYAIEYSRINSPEKLLGWIVHLCGKGMVTREHIWALIQWCHFELDISVDWHC